MMNATELYPLTPLLSFVLWVELIVYLIIGVYELLDDFLVKPKSWMKINGKTNGYVMLVDKVGHKMHAAICFLLGFIALNGVLEGQVTRFELELSFLSIALLMLTIWMSLLPGKIGFFVVTATKPEFWLQIILFVFFSAFIRIEVIYLCLFLNFWGIFVYFFHTRKKIFSPFTYAKTRSDMLDAGFDEKKLKLFDKIAGYKK